MPKAASPPVTRANILDIGSTLDARLSLLLTDLAKIQEQRSRADSRFRCVTDHIWQVKFVICILQAWISIADEGLSREDLVCLYGHLQQLVSEADALGVYVTKISSKPNVRLVQCDRFRLGQNI